MSHKAASTQRYPWIVAFAVLACCLAVPIAQPEALPAQGARSAVTPAALRTAETSPKPSGSPGHWAQGICSYKEEMLFYDEGWTAGSDGTYNSEQGNLDTCLVVGGGLTVRDEGRVNDEPGTGPIYVYKAPDGSLIAGGVMTMTLRSLEGDVYVATPLNNKEPGNLIFSCDGCVLQKQTIGLDRPEATDLYLGATCTAAPGKTVCSSEGVDAEASLQSATIVLHNEAKPTASGIAGTLLAEPASGTAGLSFTAYDKNGPGVYRVVVQIDGAVVSDFTPNENESRCVPLGTYEKALVFESAQPCPQTTGVSTEIPTSSLSNGQHKLTVTVEDAAGNSSVVYEHAITIANQTTAPTLPTLPPTSPPASSSPAPATSSQGPANGDPASEDASIAAHWHGSSNSTLASPYGRSRKIEGRLASSSGTPIADAQVEVIQRASALGAVAAALPIAHTGPNGAFTVPVPGSDSSASIELVYRSHLSDAEPAASRTLSLRVAAHLHLTVSPHVTSVGKTIILSGTLSGPVPRTGKQVILEARAPGGPWLEFHSTKAGTAGKFTSAHTFKLPGPIRYQFRAICEAEPAFPFARGMSNVVSVWER